MNKHTKGPWKSEYPVLYAASGARLVIVNEIMCATIHDLPLMAAAPDLLEVVDLFLKYDSTATANTIEQDNDIQLMLDYAEMIKKAKAAIKKAKGE